MDVGRLIECVRKHVFLYDISNKDYKNTTLKTETWEIIGKELNESSETCRLKWKTVRDGYIKYKRQLKCSNGTKPFDYIWSSKLTFLENHKVTRRSFYKPIASWKSDSVPSASNQTDGSQSPPQEELTTILSLSPPPLVPLGSLTNITEVDSTSFHVNKDLQRMIDDQNTKSKEVDATDLLFLSYSGTFKTFSARQQAILKIQLAKLFANAELEQLDNAEHSRVKVAETCLPVIIKTEYTEPGASESEITKDLNDVIAAMEANPAKRRRRGSTSRQ